MFVSKRAFQAAQDQIVKLRRELDSVQSALAHQVERERDVADAMIAARTNARDVRVVAEHEAQGLLAVARKEADTLREDARREADTLKADARKEADTLRAAAQADVAAVKADAQVQVTAATTEVARLQQVHRDLTTSFEQKVDALRSALAQATATPPAPPERREPEQAANRSPLSIFEPALPTRIAGPSSVAVAELFRDVRAETSGTLAPPASQAPRFSAFPETSDSRVQGVHGVHGVQGFQVVQGVQGIQGLQGARPERTRPRTFGRSWPRPGPVVSAAALLAPAALAWWWLARTPAPAGRAVAIAETSPSAPRTADAKDPTAPAPPASVAAPDRPVRGLAVHLQAVRNVWLHVVIDGKDTVNRLMKAGEDFSVAASRDIVVRAGDAGALLVGANGERPTAFGRDGAVVTRRFPQSVATRGARSTTPLPPEQPERSSPAVRANERTTKVVPRSAEPPAVAVPDSPAAPVAYQPRCSASNPEPPPQDSAASASRSEPADPRGAAADDQHAVLRGHEQDFQALGRGDPSGIAGLAAGGFTTTGGPMLDESGRPFPIPVSRAEVEIRGVGAVVSGTASQRVGGPGGATRDEPLLFSEVWVKRGSRWELVNMRFLSPGVKK